MRCPNVLQLQKEYIKELTIELMRIKSDETDKDGILDMIENIVACFKKEEDLELMQQCIGMRDTFRSFIAKDWRSPNFNYSKCATLNKIIGKRSVLFYSKCWKY